MTMFIWTFATLKCFRNVLLLHYLLKYFPLMAQRLLNQEAYNENYVYVPEHGASVRYRLYGLRELKRFLIRFLNFEQLERSCCAHFNDSAIMGQVLTVLIILNLYCD